MTSAAAGGDDWRIAGEDRAKHDAQFFSLKPVNGFVTGEQARGFFMQSGLPTAVLGQIWGLADMNGDGKMDKKEFSIAMHLIKKKLQGYELPKNLPATLKADPSPVMGSFGAPMSQAGMQPMGMPPVGMGAHVSMTMGSRMPMMTNGMPGMMGQQGYIGTAPTVSTGMPVSMAAPQMGMPGFSAPGAMVSKAGIAPSAPTAGGVSLAMPHNSKLKYTQMFNATDSRKRGFLTGVEARSILMQTGVPQQMLAQIWTLSDVDKDGKLDCDEFCIAMHLIDLMKMGQVLPAKLPAELLSSKARSGSFGAPPPVAVSAPVQQTDNFGDLLGNMGMPPPVQPQTNGEASKQVEDISPFTFEDRRKENFDKGQAELERRRQMLADQMKRENEARQEKERREQEKKERHRQEQEMKRQQEMERQLEKQRRIEKEREEQRRKMMEQREAARRELDRQRQMEWERQRKEQLLAEKAREYGQLTALKTQSSNMKCELDSLQGKKTEIAMKISQVRNGVTDFTAHIEAMRSTRDLKMNGIEQLQKNLEELTQTLQAVQAEREKLNLKFQTSVQSNPISEAQRTMMHSVELKRTSVHRLKKDNEQTEKETENKLADIDTCNTQMTDLNNTLANIQRDIGVAEKQKQSGKKQAEDEERIRKEKEKHETLRKELEAQRLKEESTKKTPTEDSKKEEPSSSDNWFAFGGDTKASATSDNWASVFDSQPSTQTTAMSNGDAWGSSTVTSSQPTAKSDKKIKLSGPTIRHKALYQFDSRNEDELSLVPGDSVNVYENQAGAEPGWKGGEIGGKSGWFPEAYVEKLEEESSQISSVTSDSGFSSNQSAQGQTAPPVNTSEDSSFMVVPGKLPAVSPTPGQGQTAPEGLQAMALYPWKAKKENHLTFNKGDLIGVREQQDMWWSGELDDKVGWFPKSYVKLVSGTPTSSSLTNSPAQTPTGTLEMKDDSERTSPAVDKQESAGEQYQAVYTYSSTESGDLAFSQGETIFVIKAEGDWWTGSLAGKEGIFPANYVKKNENQPVPFSLSSAPTSSQPLQGFDAFGTGLAMADSQPSTQSPLPQSSALNSVSFDDAFQSDPFNETTGGDAFNSDPFKETSGGDAFNSDPFKETSAGDAFNADPFKEATGASNVFNSDPFKEARPGNTQTSSEDMFSSDPFGNKAGLDSSQANSTAATTALSKDVNSLQSGAGPFAGFSDDPFKSGDPFAGESLNSSADVFSDFNSNMLGTDTSLNTPSSQSGTPQFGLEAGTKPAEPGTTDSQSSWFQSVEEDADTSLPTTDLSLTNQSECQAQSNFSNQTSSSLAELSSTLKAGDISSSFGVSESARVTPDLGGSLSKLGSGSRSNSRSGSSKGLDSLGAEALSAAELGGGGDGGMLGNKPAVANVSTVPGSGTEGPLTPDMSSGQASQKSTLKKPEIATVIAPYSATGAEQLSLSTGQLIQVRKKSSSGWWEGELQARGQKRKIGWFPANYVKLLGASARSTPDIGRGVSPSPLSQQSMGGSRDSPTAVRSATPNMAPPQLQTPIVTATAPAPAPTTQPQSQQYVDHVIAMYPYTAQNEDELSFQKDSVINVMKKEDADWWQGECNGHTGMFPANYVSSSSPPDSTSWSSDPQVLAVTSSAESKRQSYVHELINTEETYMADMSIVLDAFYRPMEENKAMTEEELQAVFVNWTELIICNNKLLKALRVRKKMCGKDQVVSNVGDILCESIPHMTPYIRFCSCQLSAAALLQRLTENNPHFQEIHKKCVQNPKTKGMPLSSFLLKPMQRITKYPLIVEKILTFTPVGHPDHQYLTDALEHTHEMCSQVNEGVREQENSDRLEWIQQHVHCEGLPEKITFNSGTNCLGPRKILHTGILYKAKSNKELAAFLFNDFLLLNTPNRPLGATNHSLFDKTGQLQYKMYKNPVFLNEVMVKKMAEDDPESCMFVISHIDRVFTLKSANTTDRDTWVRHIDTASRHYLETERKKREKAHSLRRSPGMGRLLVVILSGEDLKASNTNGKSDPYCEVSMGAQEHKTKVINNTLHPKWNASMQFSIRNVEEDTLCITVFDRDLFSPNNFLGRTEITVKEILNKTGNKERRPITEHLILHEVDTGEIVVKLDLHLFDQT